MGAALPIIAVAATVIGTATTAIGQVQAANASAAQGRYQAAVDRNNAITAQRLADDARARGEVDARTRRTQLAQVEGRQRASLAANGVLIDEGSALDIVSDTAALAELDALTIRSNAEREALGFETQGVNFQSSAALAEIRADQATSSIPLTVGSTLLTGAGSVAGKWYDFNQTGAFD